MGKKQRVMIFQIGSLGDTAIAIPCFREIVRRHPTADLYLLTNFPIAEKAVPSEALLAPCNLIAGCVEYPMPLRGAMNIARLWRRLRGLKIDVLYYLAPEKRLLNLFRHYIFFKVCGVGKVRSVPWSRDARFPREIVGGVLWESEGSRLLRNLISGRTPGPPAAADRSLGLTAAERSAARRLLAEAPSISRFVAISVGGKIPINNWGDDNWAPALAQISAADPTLGAVFIGSEHEKERNEALAQTWIGPKLNSCGRLTPRETAALIEQASLFLGHDTGTLHLAAAVDTRAIGIFSARNVPGKWYTDRNNDRFFYHRPPCFGCELVNVESCPNDVVCMKHHKVEEIVEATQEVLWSARTDSFERRSRSHTMPEEFLEDSLLWRR
jgi:ADP-heptose:LPS heptosyltransferase